MFKQILSNRSLQVLGLAESVSGIGNWITMLAVFSLLVFHGDGDVMQSSAIFLAGLVPTLLFSPVAGWLCDRFDRKWLMVGSELVSGLAVAGLIFTTRLELIYALLVAQAISLSIMAPARQATIPDLVAREDLTQANAFLQQLAGLVKIGAPMLAGWILSVLGPHQAIILDVVSFGLSAVILSRLPSLPPRTEQSSATQERAESNSQLSTRRLFSVVGQSARLQLLFILTFLAIVVIIGFDVLAPIFTRDVLLGDEGIYGLLIGLIGLGMVVGTVALMVRKGEHNPWHDVITGILLLACVPVSLALVTQIEDATLVRLVVGASCLLGGVGNGLILVQVGTLLQLLSPPALLGRLGGLFQSTLVAGQLVGLLVTPLLVPTLLPLWAYFAVSAGALALLGVCIILVLQRSGPNQEKVDAREAQPIV